MKTFRLSVLVFFVAAAVVLFCLFMGYGLSKDNPYVKDGKEYGVVEGSFRNRWWNYYERGLSFAEGEFYEEAVADLKQAIKGRDKDQRMARTYGMHFVDYFPHRELGIVYFNMGRYDEAEEELEESLSLVDTGRTKFFLNEVRKAILELSEADTAAPTINIASISEPETTNSFNLTLEGEVEDDSYAREIAINDEPLFIELSSQKLAFSREIKLKKGLNEIKIKGSDLLGKETEKEIRVVADFEGPALNIDNYYDGQETEETSIVLKGAIADAAGIKSLKINDTVLAYNKEKEVEFAVPLDLNDGENRISLAATDIAGNTTTGELTLTYVPQLAKKRETPDTRMPIRMALKGSGIIDAGQRLLFSEAIAKETEASFRLNLKDLTDTQTVYFDTIYLDGSATGTNKINSVKINDSPLIVIPGKTIYFNELFDLKEGENILVIEVSDDKGNNISRTITINRIVQIPHQLSSRMSIAILPFETTGDVTTLGESVYDNLYTSFSDQERFNIVSRGDELDAVLRELKLSQTDLVDQDSAVKVGRLIAAEWILMGKVTETKDSITIYARMLNTETSEAMESTDVYGQEKSLDHLQYLAKGLAIKIRNSFPLLEGIVVKISGNNIFADFGSIQGIKKEMKFIVFRLGETITHPKTGKVLGEPTEELGVARVVDVYEEMSKGKLLADFDVSKIKVEDLIITK